MSCILLSGFFCLGSDSTPLPCPEGTFRSTGRSPSHSCVACPVNFFNAKLGQAACFPCASEAVQPKEGQRTCVCLREGRVFQPSDAQCPCAPGYKSPIEDRRWDCVKQVYDICRDGAVRNEEGQCLTQEGWRHYCSDKVCALPKDYQGYDKVLGLCLCQADNLDSLCNRLCRRRQRSIFQFVSEKESARFSLAFRNGSQLDVLLEEIRASLQLFDFHTPNGCTSEENKKSCPVYVVKTSGRGFLGVYDPEPELLHYFLTSNAVLLDSQNRLRSTTSTGTSSEKDFAFYKSWPQQPSKSTLKMTFSGIYNPTTCLKIHDIVMFIVSKDHYPVYDVNSLYNTNHEFDWGGFRSLAEEAKLASGSDNFLLFFYQFHDPGTYVLRLSSNQHKRMYVRVMPYGGQCYDEGPFFPTTPRHMVQVGVARIPDLILKPDWRAIIGIIIGVVFLLIVCLLLIIFCQTFGFSRKGSPSPRFRKLQLKYNIDKYSSRESTVLTLRKYHPGMQQAGSLEKNFSHMEKREALFLGKCEIWDTEEQIDLDSFNTNAFFEILVAQSLAVTAKLSQFKEELKILYHKLQDEAAMLRDLWLAKLCIPDRADPCDDVLMGNYVKAKQQVEEEILLRKHLATEYEESVSRQLHLLSQDMKRREEHWVAFNSALREAIRLTEALAEALSSEEGQVSGSKSAHHRLLSLIDAASNQMSSTVIQETRRLMAWGILGEGTGAHLVNRERTRLLTKAELVGSDGSVKAQDVLHQDATTGLIMPSHGAVMLLGNQSMEPVSAHHFLHPGTGRLLPIAGNVGFDPVNSKLIPVVDLAPGEIRHSEVPILPYVPYPVCLHSGLPVKTRLPVLQPEKVFKLGGVMQDPATGIEVPILAVTIHPQTGQKLSLGGTYLNPLTGTVTPLELGGPMRFPEGGRIVPILGVSLDNNTGDVIPVGGLHGPSESLSLIGDSFTEPLSGKVARVQGICLQQDKMAAHAGGYQAVLDSNLLVAQIHVAQSLREYKDSICEDLCSAGDRQKALKAAEEDMKRALSEVLDYLLYQLRTLEQQRGRALVLKSTGGKLGMIKYPSTELWIPAVFGMKIPDPGGSDLMVPILGVECDWKTGQPMPLAGTMEDADGKGLVPLAVGFRTMDPITGETGPVIGAQINPWTNAVIPVVQSLGNLPRGNPDPELSLFLQLAGLEKEINAKQAYWHCQREKEEELFKELDFICLDVLDAAKEGKMKKLRYKIKLRPADEIYHLLEESSAQEIQRRASRDQNMLWDTEQSLRMRVDKDERDQEARVRLLLRKMLEKLVQFIRKMQLEEGRIQMQLKEAERQWSRGLRMEEAIREKSRKITLHLVAGFQEHIAKQQTSVESAHCRLEYFRYLSHTLALQTKDLLSGSSQCFLNYPGAKFYSAAGTAHGSWEVINRKLIPLLKSVVQTLEENKRGPLSPEVLLGLGSGEGYSSRSTLKVSEAAGEAFRTETRQEMALAAATLSPVPPSWATPNRSQLLQEIHTRIFLEKHASEMVHLELSLMAEEINMISCFCESSKLRKDLGMTRRHNLGAANDWDNLLKELAEYHQHAEEELRQQHWEEIKCAGLSPEERTLKDGALFSLEEILQNLASLGADLQKAGPPSRLGLAKANSETQTLESKLGRGSVAQKLRATASKIVKQEAMKQMWIHRVLDCYNHLQRWSCPEGVLQVLDNLCYTAAGEMVACEVAQSAEQHQVERAMTFLQKSSKEGEILVSFKEMDEAELRKLQTLIQMELQAQIEEKRHLRQTVLVSEGLSRLRKAGPRTAGDQSSTEDLAQEEPLVDEGMKGVAQLLKGEKQYEDSVLELQHTAQMLQLRERQFQETVEMLKAHSLDKQRLEDAHQIASGLQDFRQQKTRELAEQLRTCLLGSQKAKEGTSSNPSPPQSESPPLEKKDKGGKGKEKWVDSQEARLVELEESYREQILEEKAKLEDQLERGEMKKWSKQKLIREHDETVTFLDKAFRQDMHKLRGRMEKDQKRIYSGQEDGNSLTSEAASLPGQNQPSLAEDRVLSLLTENIKVLKQTELLVSLRTTLLNPRFTALLSDSNGAGGMTSSKLLALLKDVNCQIQKCAAAVGLLDVHRPEYDKVNSFQDIMDTQMVPKSRDLVPLLTSTLSAREFVVYQYGMVILKFLRPHIGAPEIDLCIASSIPSSNTPGNAFRNSFHYQTPGNKLFVLRECLSCVGSFILLLVHCLAHITAEDLSQDSSPAFRRLFYQALKACLGEMFSLRLQTSAVLEDSKSAAMMINEAFLKGEGLADEKINLLSGLLDAKVKPSADLEEEHESLLLDVDFDDSLRSKLPGKKKDCYSHILPSSQEILPSTSSQASSYPHTTPEAAADKLDVLNEKLVTLLQEEEECVSRSGAGGASLFDELKAIGLEKDSLLKEIKALERKVAEAKKGRPE
nr:uncharacterized protein LOC118097186 isoform X5 [Zootoca vivipara]